MPIFVTKASGEREPFDVEKLRRTCERAGASKKLAAQVAAAVEKKVYDGIPTKEILDLILKELEKEKPYIAARYDLKGAIMRLGPAGFMFEQVLGELLE
jgi:transcriptional regulator NrdR family protein